MTETLDRVKTALADRYRIQIELGRGGMATVYLAHDLRYDRDVAIKVLRSDVSHELGGERFLREIKLVAKLSHPHILPLLDSGEADGFLFYVMPYIDGETLRDRLHREKQLPIADALQLAREVATGLRHAHEHGVTHRDVKPENILLAGRTAVLADFGIAKAVSRVATRELTQTGTAVGTPYYMSPEQASGESQLDGRSDIYSLGCVLYEMLAGEPPFTGPTAESILRQHQTAEIPDVTVMRPRVPDGVVEILTGALAKAPADRYLSAEALAEELSHQSSGETLAVRVSRRTRATRRRWTMGGTLALVGGLVVTAGIIILPRVGAPGAPILATQRQVTFVGNVAEASVSPEGEFLAYTTRGIDGTTLAVQDLQGGSTIEIASSPDLLFHPTWSPDGRQILVATSDTSGFSLVGYPRLGGEPSVFAVNGIGRWSVDGRQVYSSLVNWGEVQFHTVGSGKLAHIPTPDTNAWLVDVAQRPQGDALAIVHAHKDREVYSIWRLGVDSAQRFGDPVRADAPRDELPAERLIEDATQLLSVLWGPAGDRLYYLRYDRGTHQLWKVQTTARGSDAPELLMSGIQLARGSLTHESRRLSLTADGSQLYVVKGRSSSNLWSVRRRDDAWTVSPLTTGTAYSVAPRASPNGQWVAYLSTSAGNTNVFVAPAAGGSGRQLTMVDSVSGGPAWSPDGKALAFGLQRNDENHVAVVTMQDPTTIRVFEETALSGNGTIEWAPGPAILYQTPSVQNFHLLDPDTGEERPLLDEATAAAGWLLAARYSPDGTRVAVNWNRRVSSEDGLYLISVTDGSYRQLTALPPAAFPVGWSPDGQIVYALWADRREVLTVPVTGGTPSVLTTLPFAPDTRIATTDFGRWFVFASPETTGDVWRIENFDPQR